VEIVKQSLKKALSALGVLRPFLAARNSFLEYLQRRKEPSGRKFIISANMGGICNRIKCLVTCMRLAQKSSRTVELSWGENDLCRCKFSDLFENKFIGVSRTVVDILSQSYSPVKHDRYFIVNTWRFLTLPGEFAGNHREFYPSPGGNSIDFEFDRIPQALRDEFLACLNRLTPIRYVRQEVERFAKRFGDSTVSVSIRSWPEARSIRAFLFKLENVYSVLDKEADSDFFVSCDSAEVLEALTRRYGDRVISYPKRTGVNNRTSRIGMQDILIDLLLLARNKSLKISAFSTYSEMAWWFGGCKAKVEILESKADIENFSKPENLNNYATLIPADLLRRTGGTAEQRRPG
jgi:hypothetical protein